MIRSAFEYQGQKCSTVTRAYIPHRLWTDLKDFILEEMKTVKMGDVEDFSNFINSVIEEEAFSKITEYIEFIEDSNETEIICSGNYDCRKASRMAEEILVNAAGNFYISDKPTGEVVGQHPFGGSRTSGTNDKAGCFLNMIRWTCP